LKAIKGVPLIELYGDPDGNGRISTVKLVRNKGKRAIAETRSPVELDCLATSVASIRKEVKARKQLIKCFRQISGEGCSFISK
jgi:hypothetical protein